MISNSQTHIPETEENDSRTLKRVKFSSVKVKLSERDEPSAMSWRDN